MSVAVANDYARPIHVHIQNHTPVPRQGELHYGGLFLRVFAWQLEGSAVGLICFACTVVAALTLGFSWVLVLLLPMLPVLVTLRMLCFGQTPGKWLCNLTVVDSTSRPVGLVMMIFRLILSPLHGLFFLNIFLWPRTVVDRILGQHVVLTSSISPKYLN
jgi:uncharacterized RDD family membrane protein YckC